MGHTFGATFGIQVEVQGYNIRGWRLEVGGLGLWLFVVYSFAVSRFRGLGFRVHVVVEFAEAVAVFPYDGGRKHEHVKEFMDSLVGRLADLD